MELKSRINIESTLLLFLITLLIFPNCGKVPSNEKIIIKQIIHDSFGWALKKDRALFENLFSHDDDFFTFYPDSRNTVSGWNQFETYLDLWMDPRNVAKGFEIRDLRIIVSRTCKTAWFSAFVDDEGEWEDQPWGTKDVRWTGILEKRAGRWIIVQQHMSEAKDKIIGQMKEESR